MSRRADVVRAGVAGDHVERVARHRPASAGDPITTASSASASTWPRPAGSTIVSPSPHERVGELAEQERRLRAPRSPTRRRGRCSSARRRRSSGSRCRTASPSRCGIDWLLIDAPCLGAGATRAPRRGARESGRWSPRRRRRAASRRSPGRARRTSRCRPPRGTAARTRRSRSCRRSGRDGSDRRHDVVDPDARAGEVVHRRALGRGETRGDERARDIARVLELGAAAVRDRVGRRRRPRRASPGRSRGDALVAADAVDGVRPQADARDAVLGRSRPGRSTRWRACRRRRSSRDGRSSTPPRAPRACRTRRSTRRRRPGPSGRRVA